MKKLSAIIEESARLREIPVVTKESQISLREQFIANKIFNVGDMVSSDVGIAEIINRGTNYVTIISEGKTYRKWITDIQPAEGQHKRNQIFKEAFIVKGYKTQNFTREIAEEFSKCSKVFDQFALFSATQCVDKLLGYSKESIFENFESAKVEYERAARLLKKLKLEVAQMDSIENWLIEYSILESARFSTKNQIKVAHIIAQAVGHAPTSKVPHEIIHDAIDHVKSQRLTPEGWKLLGGMMNVATSAGIQWDKTKFHKTTQKFMGLR
jgi:hypothetical protein